ncbi:MAG: hypothetical protein EPO07_18020 [Verrucomicrobia bacterium]|nr:MAG: hypothetical protein EPO07_18020 [Verrucomicrobiota bacterium]
MKRNFLLATLTLIAGSLLAADSSPKDDVASAAKKLGEKANYSWHTTVAVPEGSRFRPGPTDGKTEKDGVTHLKMSFGDNTTEAFLKGDKGAVSDPDGGWQSLADLDNAEGPRRFMGGMLRNFKAPAVQAAELAGDAKELKKDGDALAGELTEERAKALLTFRPRAGSGGEAPAVSGAKGSVKFWVKDGVLAKYEFNVSGKINFNGTDRDVERTTTTEIKEVGSTKVEVPDEAKKKLTPEPAASPAKK